MAGGTDTFHRLRTSVVPTILIWAVMGGLVAASTVSLIAGIATIVVALGVVLILTFGTEKIAAVGFIAAAGFGPLQGLTLPGASFVTATDLLLVLSAFVLAPSLVTRPFKSPWQFTIGAALFLMIGVVASLAALNPGPSLFVFVRIVIGMLFVPILYLWWAPNRVQMLWCAGAYLVGVCVDIVYALAVGPDPNLGRYVGLAETPPAFGFSAVLAISLVPFLWWEAGLYRRIFVAGAALFAIYGIWISGTRSALILLAALVVIFPFLERSLVAFGGLAALGAVGLVMLPRVIDLDGTNALARLLGGGGSRGSDQARLDGLRNALEVIETRPLIGNGFADVTGGAYGSFQSHNIYTQVTQSAGLFMLVAFLLLVWAFVRPLFLALPEYRRVAYPALAYILAGPITPNLGSRYVCVLLALALTATAFIPRKDGAEDGGEDNVGDTADGPGPQAIARG
ncbi:O-antigen ligase family protein [Nocardioides caeni]|uniref:O-antigen ligase family protein n=1 Tax=Nocardioides caeni TaxID=574700 RepID=A0A4S8N0B9_9ACTN|nr:O-antigen ligase family protein [Nocardioides caeni]THV09200.1 O-antigen ligase family protein [Nocardioides caeni]